MGEKSLSKEIFQHFWKELKRWGQEGSKYALLGPSGLELGGILVGVGERGQQDGTQGERISSLCMNKRTKIKNQGKAI